MKSVFLPLAIVASLGAAPAASASGLHTILKVAYEPSALRREAGVRSLERRVSAAVRQVCGVTTRRPLHETAATRNCVETASADAQAQVHEAVSLSRLASGVR